MDPAREMPICSEVEMQGALLDKHEEELSVARQAVVSLAAQVTDLTIQLHHLRQDQAISSVTRNSSEPRINNPPCYSGEPSGFFDPM